VLRHENGLIPNSTTSGALNFLGPLAFSGRSFVSTSDVMDRNSSYPSGDSAEPAPARRGILGAMPIDNPFQDPLRFERRVPECAVVISAPMGPDQAQTAPALYRLAYDRRLSAGFAVVGISRTPMTDEAFREKMLEAVKEFSEDTTFDADVWKAFAAGSSMWPATLATRPSIRISPAGWRRSKPAPYRRQRHVLSLHPAQPICARGARTGRRGFGEGKRWRRLVVEKPFGTTWPARAN